jgi:flagellar motor switch protein FliN
MSTALSLPRENEALAYLQREAAACWGDILDRAFGSTGFDPEVLDMPAASEDCLWLGYDLTPAELGCVVFGLRQDIAVALGHGLLRAKGRASEHDHHAIHATNHVMTQLADGLAAGLSSHLKTKVAVAEPRDAEQPAASHSFTVPFPGTANDKISLKVCPAPELIGALIKPFSTPAVSNATAPYPAARNLDLLLDVEMPVSVSFGTTRIQLKDAAKLTTGSVVELNRSLSEPIDIIVNNRSIARGEVVIVDGNFAVRIKEIMSKQDRLRSLA